MTKKKNLVPLRQGDLDGLCSIYAVFNAIRWISDDDFMCIEEGYEDAHKIFAWAFTEGIVPIDTVWSGSDVEVVTNLLEHLKSQLKSFKYRQIKRKENIFNLLDRGPLIIGFTGIDNHWSVITHYDEKYFYMFDSISYKKFKLTDVLTEFKIPDSGKVCITKNDMIHITKT